MTGQTVDDQELAMINRYAIRELIAEEVYTFKVALCDNEIDRDGEAFTRKSLDRLAELYAGKTIITNHSARAENQCARIYAAEVVEEPHTASTGEPYARLVARCYTIRTDSTKDLIAGIDAGITKEVSVGCRIGAAFCSVCGADNIRRACPHKSGEVYEGTTCYIKLENPTDAYEVSFVAVPAQPNAGVTKSHKPGTDPQNEVIGDRLRIMQMYINLQEESE